MSLYFLSLLGEDLEGMESLVCGISLLNKQLGPVRWMSL